MTVPRAPAGILLTWRTYGTWLPGDERGWVSDGRNGRGEPLAKPDARLEAAAKGLMRASAVTFDEPQRELVARSIRDTCTFRGWHVFALNVRTNHVHVVLGSDALPDEVLVTLKKQATKALRASREAAAGAPVWARGGSHRLLMSDRSLAGAIDYVLNRQ